MFGNEPAKKVAACRCHLPIATAEHVSGMRRFTMSKTSLTIRFMWGAIATEIGKDPEKKVAACRCHLPIATAEHVSGMRRFTMSKTSLTIRFMWGAIATATLFGVFMLVG